MCEFCSYKNNPFIIYGKEIKINKCAKETDLTEAQIMRNRDDEVPGIVIIKDIARPDILISIIALSAVESWWSNGGNFK